MHLLTRFLTKTLLSCFYFEAMGTETSNFSFTFTFSTGKVSPVTSVLPAASTGKHDDLYLKLSLITIAIFCSSQRCNHSKPIAIVCTLCTILVASISAQSLKSSRRPCFITHISEYYVQDIRNSAKLGILADVSSNTNLYYHPCLHQAVD